MSTSVIAQVTFKYYQLTNFIFNWVLYGFLCSQSLEYFRAFPKDSTWNKILVAYLLLLTTVQSALNMHDTFITFGTHFGNVEELIDNNLAVFSSPILIVMASCPVQIFYARRMTLFSRSNYICMIAIIVTILALFSSAFSIVIGISLFQDQPAPKLLRWEQIWLGSSSACDTMMTLTMIVLLKKSSPNSKQTKQVVSKVVRLLIESGFVTAAFSIADMGVLRAFPAYPYHTPICGNLGNLHFLTLLVVLNNRSYLTKFTNSQESLSVVQSTLRFAHPDESTNIHTQSLKIYVSV
ncbi:hypothetical protein GYMLUDRAFT_76349 [Collybiopsis luxurians FD-317 M1]|uniref:DUF6534 domain-containing protein n=1 Tax=Collybiopsis luxurians FD-317 M1 TaxID=944289 RepID=A0A0D0AYS8_9AGAR|nr:hypothetical protein GYMLUDRAFT_76349 [Collybiopsis luxurians FD-317 M1]